MLRFPQAVSVALLLLLSGCAQTTVFENGTPVLKTQADATNVTFRTAQGTYFHADTLNHSVPTLAGGQSASGIIGASSGLAGAIGGVVIGQGLVKGGHSAAAVLSTVAPSAAQIPATLQRSSVAQSITNASPHGNTPRNQNE